jgi:hypothetical protein
MFLLIQKKWPELGQPLLKWEVVKRKTNLFRKTDTALRSSSPQKNLSRTSELMRERKVTISAGGEEQEAAEEQQQQEGVGDATAEDNVSVSSSVIAKWKSYILWTQIVAHFEDWPDRLDDSEMESEGSSQSSDAEEDTQD